MIEIISPKSIYNNKEIKKDLKKYDMDFENPGKPAGWNYYLDYSWLYKEIKGYLQKREITNPIIFDVGCGNSEFYQIIENELNVKVLGIDRPEGFCHQNKTKNVEYFVDFLKFKEFPKNSLDIIYWLSAIEHNKPHQIRKLYKKSKHFLKKDGLLLMTFAISKETHWYQPSQQTNLSIKDATKIFKDHKVVGEFDEIHQQYRDNVLKLKDRYKKRYKGFEKEDPQFIVGGLKQIKSRRDFFL